MGVTAGSLYYFRLEYGAHSYICAGSAIDAAVEVDRYSSASGAHKEAGDMKSDSYFKQAVHDIVLSIPYGKVMTYGQVAALCGSPRAARIVGQIAHFGPEDIPWHRVVYKDGSVATEYSFGGLKGHMSALKSEGVELSDGKINNIETYIWWPEDV